MGNIAFSDAEFAHLIKRFATDMPRLLLRHGSTAELAQKIDRLNLLDIFHQRFTVAIIGQMKVGKSTLINALIDKNLAPVGVTETTATVNWFRYSGNEPKDVFRVHWRDGSSEDFHISEIDKWVGNQEKAQLTKSIDFFAQTDFLETANVVDTPGTRSSNDSHENTVQGFLADELDKESLAYGGRADAILYAINPLAREADKDLLTRFGENTRLLGASPTNCIAVVQKWEHLENPFDNIQKKCARLLEDEQLYKVVADVIPTSSTLARLSSTVPEKICELLIKLVRESKPEGLTRILKSPRRFARDDDDVSLEPAELEEVKSAINDWRLIPLCVFVIRENPDVTVRSLPDLFYEKSGVGKLHEALEERFFSRSRFIKANTIIAKTRTPCATAKETLDKRIRDKKRLLTKGNNCLAQTKSDKPEEVSAYLEETIDLLQKELDELTALAKEVDELKHMTERNFKSFDEEQKAISLLQDENYDLNEDRKAELRALFGISGIEPFHRLSIPPDTPSEGMIEAAVQLLEYWNPLLQNSAGNIEQLARAAVNRLDELVNYLDASEEAGDEPDRN